MLFACVLIALQVQAADTCPSARDVERELGPLLGEAAAAADVATIAAAGNGGLRLSLADATGQSIGERTLPRARTCGEQAKAVAVTLAVWEVQLHPEISLGLERLATPEPAAVPAAPAQPAPVTAHAIAMTLGLAALADRQSGSWAPAARVEVGVGPADARWRLRFAAAAVGRHTLELPPGRAAWWRAIAQAGADVDALRGDGWAAVVGTGLLGAVLFNEGTGFAADRATRSFDLGGEARARVEVRLGREHRFRPWVGGLLAVWARRQTLELQGASTSVALPSLEPMAAVGMDFAW
jgi:hypothetical protein